MIGQFYLTHRLDPNGYCHSRQSEPVSNGYEVVLHRTEVLSSDSV